MGDIKKVYITKYALTEGILVKEVEDLSEQYGHKFCRSVNDKHVNYFHKNDFFYTEAEAKKHANKMVDKKIASIKKSLAKFENLKF